MALFLKQDFSPPVLSRKWIAIKFRPNMLLYSREHIISVLESGLLFREDSAAVEQECPAPDQVWACAGGGGWGWCTRGERAAALVAGACALALTPGRCSSGRDALVRAAASACAAACARGALRVRARRASPLRPLLGAMQRYLALARRAQACLRDQAAHNTLGSVSEALESMHALLCQQQTALATLMSRASASLLGNAPWLRADLAWDSPPDSLTLQKIHHAFLVVQSTLLKHIAMAHFMQSPQERLIFKNHNERLYWIHSVLLTHLLQEFEDNYEALDRMYRLFKNYGTKDVQKKTFPVNDRWLYSEVHSGVARTCLELKIALEKCTNLDMFLDSCAINDQELNLDVLNEDIDDLIDELTKCLCTAQSAQIRLKKLQRKFAVEEERKKESEEEEEVVVKITEPEPVKDEVFYLLKTEDDVEKDEIADITTAPGKKEKEATKFMLNELKRKLVKREDVMRERERQALVKTMPELKDIPEFPRQIKMEDYFDRKGYINKVTKDIGKERLFKNYRIGAKLKRRKKYKLNVHKYESESEIKADTYEANAKLKARSKIISISSDNKQLVVTKWSKNRAKKAESTYSSEKESEASIRQAVNNNVNKAVNRTIHEASNHQLRFSKKELELTPSSSESDFELYKEQQLALLKDIRKHRAARKKNHPVKRVSIDIVDESLKPVEYSFGTGMAIASVLQVNNNKMPNMAEEFFIGDGEVSNDSGNDEDA